MGKSVIIIKATGDTEVKELDKIDYDFLNQTCGGWIQHISFGNGVAMYCNEEGKIDGLPYNHKATSIWVNTYGDTDLISGDVVIVGDLDDEGEDSGLTADQISHIEEVIETAGEPTPDDLARYQRVLLAFRS
jgi:hypothetical protein